MTKKCPYCAEEIQEEAKVCRWCTRGLVDEETDATVTPERVNANYRGVKALKEAVAKYQLQGWIIQSQLNDTVQMVRAPEKPSALWWGIFITMIVCGFFTLVTFIVALIMWFTRASHKPECIILTIDADGNVVTNGNVPNFSPATFGVQRQNTMTDSVYGKGSTPITSTPTVPSKPKTSEEIAAQKQTTKIILIALGVLFVLCLIVMAASCGSNGNAPIGLLLSVI